VGCLQTMWSHLRLLWVRRPVCLQRMWADECLCLWASLRMIVDRYRYGWSESVARQREGGHLPSRHHRAHGPLAAVSGEAYRGTLLPKPLRTLRLDHFQ
jgi:hypothetical protein